MKKLLFFLVPLLASCATTIPLQTNLDNSVMLMTKNRNIKVEYKVTSLVPDGFIAIRYVQRNGNISATNVRELKYDIETGLKAIWKNYFDLKFNEFSDETMTVDICQTNFYLADVASSSVGELLLTGSSEGNYEAHSQLEVSIEYKGKMYRKMFNVSSTGYHKSIGEYHNTNPTAQRSALIQDCLNKGIIMFDNFISSIDM